MKKLTSLILALSLALSLVGCGGGKAPAGDGGGGGGDADLFPERTEEVKLTFWHSITNEVIYDSFKKVLDEFNTGVGAEKKIHVEEIQYPSAAELNTAVTAAIMSKSAPDLVTGTPIYMVDYANAGALVDMTPYIESEAYGMDMNEFYDCWLLNCNNYDEAGSYFCLPILAYSEVVYYNVDFFKEHNLTIPTTWDEMEALCQQIKDITGEAGMGWDNAAKMFSTLVEQAGIGYTDPQGNILFGGDNLEGTISTIQRYVDNLNSGIYCTPGDNFYFSGPFANQDIPMYVGSGVEGAYIDMKIDPNHPFEWGTFPVPQLSADSKAVYSESSLISIVDQGENYDKRLAAWEFLKYFESKDAVMTMASAGSYLPVLKSVATDETWLSNASPSQKTGVEQMDSYYTFYGFDNGSFTSSGLYADVKAGIENILGNGADLTSTITGLAESHAT